MLTLGDGVPFATPQQFCHRRTIPSESTILVQVGDYVSAGDALAQSVAPGRLHLVDALAALGVSARRLADTWQVGEGDAVSEGDTLARVRRRICAAPVDGVVQGIVGNTLYLRATDTERKVCALVPGRVSAIEVGRSVTIAGSGARLAGVWGCGGDGQGMLVVPTSEAAEPLGWGSVTRRNRGDVLAAGLLEDGRALRRAAQFGVVGILAGSMNPELAPLAQKLGLTVVLTEGLGAIPLCAEAHGLLRAHQGRRAALSGGETMPVGQPELILPWPGKPMTAPPSVTELRSVGSKVRLTRAPYLGSTGAIVSIPVQPQRTTAGAFTEGAVVTLENGQRVFVPWVNLELLY